MQVIKRSGEREDFDRRKTLAAIQRAGVAREEAETVVAQIEAQLYNGITTEEIYRRVHQLLQGRRAARYGLKKAFLRLGPEGEYFERYIARLFQVQGFETENRLILQGKCVGHEIDVLMERGGERTMVECKFHNSLGTKSNIQCALYVHARFLDLKDEERIARPMLVTNTRFTSDVERYARCVGMDLLGWNYPEGRGLEDLATTSQLFPVTLLDMRRSDLLTLLAHRLVSVDEVLSRVEDVRRLLSRESAQDAERQAREVLGR